jgi:hypothetical protein
MPSPPPWCAPLGSNQVCRGAAVLQTAGRPYAHDALGVAGRCRTCDLGVFSPALCRLSYHHVRIRIVDVGALGEESRVAPPASCVDHRVLVPDPREPGRTRTAVPGVAAPYLSISVTGS